MKVIAPNTKNTIYTIFQQTSAWPHGSTESSHLPRNQLRQVNQRNGIGSSCVILTSGNLETRGHPERCRRFPATSCQRCYIEPGFSLGVHAFFRECPEDCTTTLDVDTEWYKPTISRRLSKTREELNVKNMFDFSQ